MCLPYTFVLRKPEEKRPLRRRWAENIKLTFKEIRLEGVDWTFCIRIGTVNWLVSTW
jgi:hypothetical protein